MWMRSKILILAGLAAVSVATTVARADDSSDDRDVSAVRAAGKKYVEALRNGDVDKARKMWTPDGDYIDARGNRTESRKMFGDRDDTRASEKGGGDIEIQERTIRIVAPGVAIEDGKFGETAAADGSSVSGRYTATWVKRDGDWLLASLRESEVVTPSGKDRLQELSWLVGEWIGKTEDGEILVSSHFRDDDRYIVREFVDRGSDHATVTGTQRIGWDPASGKIKCWTFDSQGGIGEGTWRREGNRWVVEMADVLPNGEKVSLSTAYVPTGDGRFVWESGGAKLGDERVPPRRVEFKRAED
jgi:uncharacterized protein (TIGR02246 family)